MHVRLRVSAHFLSTTYIHNLCKHTHTHNFNFGKQTERIAFTSRYLYTNELKYISVHRRKYRLNSSSTILPPHMLGV